LTRGLKGQGSNDVSVQAALRTTAALKPGSDTELDAQILEDIAEDAPSTTLSREQAIGTVADVMVATGMQKSKGAARRCAINHMPEVTC
jgi:hypothetical protein